MKKNACDMNNKMLVPREKVKHDKKSDGWMKVHESIGISDDSDEKEENKCIANSGCNESIEVDDKIKHKNKNKETGKSPFEIIERISQTMEKLGNIVIDFYYDLDES